MFRDIADLLELTDKIALCLWYISKSTDQFPALTTYQIRLSEHLRLGTVLSGNAGDECFSLEEDVNH